MDSVRSGPYGQIFRPDNFIFGQASSESNIFSNTDIPQWRSKCLLSFLMGLPLICRLVLATTGQRDTTQREQSSLTLSLML